MKNLLLILALFVGNAISSVQCSSNTCTTETKTYEPRYFLPGDLKEVKVGDEIFREIVEENSLFLNIPEQTVFKQAHYGRRCEIEVQDKKSPFKYGTLEGAFGQTKVYMCAEVKVKNIDTKEKCNGLAKLFRNRICFAKNYINSDLNKENPLLRRHIEYMEFSEQKFRANKYNLNFSKEKSRVIDDSFYVSYIDDNQIEITKKDNISGETLSVKLDYSGMYETSENAVLKIPTYENYGAGNKFFFYKRNNKFFYEMITYSHAEAKLDKEIERRQRYFAKLTKRCIGFGYKDENSIKGCVQQEKFNEEKLEKQRQEFKAEQYKIAQLEQELKDAKSEAFWDGVWQQVFSNYTQQKMNNAFQNKINNLENKLRREQRFNRKQRKKPNEYKQLEPIKYSN